MRCAAGRRATTAKTRSDFALNVVDILVLACFAIAQPLFQVLSRSEALFIVHGSRPSDVLLLAFGAWAVPGTLLILVEWIAGRFVGPLHRLILALLLALIVLPIVRRLAPVPGSVSIAVALAAGVFFSTQYLRVRSWRWSVVYLSPALVVFPALLLFHSPVSAILFPGRAPEAARSRVGNPAPVVMVVFDEFPLASLLDKDGQIDAALYPNFAALSRSGTWYRNTTTVSDGTLIAVPAILDGLFPTPEHPRLPNAAGHPNTLFTLLGGSYRMHVVENNTHLCPEPLCGSAAASIGRRLPPLVRDAAVLWLYAVLPSDLTGPLPDISQSWANFTKRPEQKATLEVWNRFDDLTDWRDRRQEFREFTDAIRSSRWPALHFLHILLPHAPWEYLPSGQRYVVTDGRIRGVRGPNDRGEDTNLWTGDSSAVIQSYQRCLLQVGFVDRLVGTLVKRLRETGIYDSSLVVITADHGASFRPGDSRRTVTPANRSDIMPVPLFIKYPHQQQGGIDDRNAQTIDILPTIAQVLKVKTGWKLDGRSLLLAPSPGTEEKIIFSDSGAKYQFNGGLKDLYEGVGYKLEVFGADSHSAGCLYRVGDRYGWIGRQPAAPAAEPGLRYRLDREAYFSKVDPGSPNLVTNITGRVLRSSRRDAPLPLAVAVNGTVRAVAQTYQAGGEELFWVMVPPEALRAGYNDIEVHLIRNGGAGLARLERDRALPYDWGTRLNFGYSGNADPYAGTGWSGPEEHMMWTDGHAATVYLPGRAPDSNLVMRVNLGAYTLRGKLDRQRVRVLVNGHEVANWVAIAAFQTCTALVPRADTAGAETTQITLELPDAVAPISIGAGSDNRTLGVAVAWLQLAPQGSSR
jgi:hypothetical protein